MLAWFPVAFRPPAFASRPSCPAWYSAPLAIGLPAPAAPDHDGVSTFRTREMRPEWAPSVPRDQRCSARAGRCPRPAARRITTAMVLYPGTSAVIYPGLHRHEASIKGSHHSPARPSPHLWPPDDSGALGLYPGLRTRAGKTRARTPGRGQAQSTSLEPRLRHLRHAGPPICEFTRTCATSVSHHRSMVLRETCTPRPPGPACTWPAMRRTTRPRCFVVSPSSSAGPISRYRNNAASCALARRSSRSCSAEDTLGTSLGDDRELPGTPRWRPPAAMSPASSC